MSNNRTCSTIFSHVNYIIVNYIIIVRVLRVNQKCSYMPSFSFALPLSACMCAHVRTHMCIHAFGSEGNISLLQLQMR